MQLLVMKDEDGVYRVRKEDVGCSIFTPQSFVEGDDMLFEILKALHEGGVPGGIETLKARYQAEAGQIEADLLAMAEGFEEGCIFPGLSRQIRECLGGGSP